jgi:Spy/CpxP family protein refolding chaperone
LDRAHTALLESFREHLDLTDDQVARIEDIMQRTVAEAHRIMHAEQPAMRELHDRAQREVLEVLTPEQAIEYRRMMAHHPLGPSSGH